MADDNARKEVIARQTAVASEQLAAQAEATAVTERALASVSARKEVIPRQTAVANEQLAVQAEATAVAEQASVAETRSSSAWRRRRNVCKTQNWTRAC